MAISRIPGFSLKANLDRKGTDLYISSTGTTLAYWDVANFRYGINTDSPHQALHVSGNTIIGNGHVYTGANLAYDLGETTKRWGRLYSNEIMGTLLTPLQPNVTALGTLTALTVTGTSNLGQLEIASSKYINMGNNVVRWGADPVTAQDLSTKAYVDAQVGGAAQKGNVIPLGTPTDGNIADGAYTGWTSNTFVTNAIDDLNEMVDNVRTNTFVKAVSFSGSPLEGGAGTTVTLSITPIGNANRYDVAWGDGNYSNSSASTGPTHTYSTNTGSPFTVIVRAFNTGAYGTGSEASQTRTNYIIIYTANPVAAFALYRASSGGSALSGSTLYFTEGDTAYLQNITTNTGSATVAYQVNWGDGSANVAVANDSASGGVSGTRLAYRYLWGAGSGTGTIPVNLYLTAHNTADPAVIPNKQVQNVKLYDANIAVPAGVNTKLLTFSSSVGTSPLLAFNATDNVAGGATLSANSSVSRTIATGSSLIRAASGNISTSFTYNANVGYLQAVINGTVRGNVNIATVTGANIYGNLGTIGFGDYHLLNSAGATVSFASSTYSPQRFYGFKANILARGDFIQTGINRFQINHSSTGQTANIEFVKDNLTVTPTVTAGTLAEGTAGTKRFISGVPYYNTGSPTLNWSGVTIENWIGQTYRNTSSPVQALSSTNYEGTSSSAISTQNYTYAQTLATTASGRPIANTGIGAANTISTLSVPITSSSVRTIDSIAVRAYNVNGTSSSVQNTTKLAVHTASQSGISEIAISCNIAQGGANTNPARRTTSFIASTAHNPSYTGTTQFISAANSFIEASDPGVAGTRESEIRIGVIKHTTANYSTGYLPAGPNRSGTEASNYQYFTAVFQRSGLTGFNTHLVAPAGVAGMWVALPNSFIDDTSGINGWMDALSTTGGSGRPGSNTGTGGNGSDGCATGTVITGNTATSGTFTMSMGNVSTSTSQDNQVLVRFALAVGQTITTLAFSA
jgi:hypothetical protein|tara:strand:- start:1037 stop:3946 length:2910 start_codon:yes stop_codon:yes gene_type:complete